VVLFLVAISPWLLVIVPLVYFLYRFLRPWIVKRLAGNVPPVLLEEDGSD
jgi:hypothetical protein